MGISMELSNFCAATKETCLLLGTPTLNILASWVELNKFLNNNWWHPGVITISNVSHQAATAKIAVIPFFSFDKRSSFLFTFSFFFFFFLDISSRWCNTLLWCLFISIFWWLKKISKYFLIQHYFPTGETTFGFVTRIFLYSFVFQI